MLFKDYYKILGVPFTASAEEIKRSYRKLALKYHPDKTSGDKNAESKFREVKEAYEILSKPIRREGFDYDYKKHYQTLNGKPPGAAQQQPTAKQSSARPQQQSQGQGKGPAKNTTATKEGASLTAAAYLARAQSIQKAYSAASDLKELPKLYSEVDAFLKQSTISQLLKWGDAKTNNTIVATVLSICNLLPYQYIDSIGIRLAQLAGTDNATISSVYNYCRMRKKKINRQRWILIIAMLLLVFLFFLFIS
jgi:molecular chaperone DnaJ